MLQKMTTTTNFLSFFLQQIKKNKSINLQQITRNEDIILQQSKALGCCKKLQRQQQQQIAEFLQQLTTNQTKTILILQQSKGSWKS
jgi:hypothetical protein